MYDRVAIAEITLRPHESLVRLPELDLAGSLIDAKVAGREVTTPPPEITGAPATDLTSALRASVEAASRNRQRTGSVAASGSVAALRPG